MKSQTQRVVQSAKMATQARKSFTQTPKPPSSRYLSPSY